MGSTHMAGFAGMAGMAVGNNLAEVETILVLDELLGLLPFPLWRNNYPAF